MQSYVYLADVVLQRIKVRITKLIFFPHFLKPCLVIIDWLLLIDMSPTHILHRPDGAAVQGIGVVLGMVFILALSMFLPSLYIRGWTFLPTVILMSMWYPFDVFRSVDSSDVENPGNNLYVTGLSARVTDRDLEKHFSAEGEVTFIEYLQRDTKIVYNFLSSPYYRLLTLA